MHKTSIALLAALFPLSVSAQAIDPVIPDRAPKKLSAHVYVIQAWPNIGFVVGEKAVLVVDTGLGPKNGATIARAAEKLAAGKNLYLTTTHYHPEHAMGDAGFSADTKILRCERQQKELDTVGSNILTRFQRNPVFQPYLQDVTWRKPDIVFERETTLDLGGVSARLLCLGNTHTDGDLEIFIAADSVLFSGDVVQNKLFPSFRPEGGNPKQWIAVIDQLGALNAKILVPTHGALGDASTLPAYRAFISDIRERALALKGDGKSAEEAAQIVNGEIRAKYSDWTARDLSAAVTATYKE